MDGLNQLLKKLIRSGTGRKRFVIAVFGLSIAMLLILSAVQIQANYNQLLTGKSNQDSIANFLVLNKSLTDETLGKTSLADSDITDLKKQSFVEAVGLLTPSRFKASLQSNSTRFPFYTDIAFESVPDDFIDVSSKDWRWTEQSPFVPIIVPNMFLDFYNFQFSFSQNLPQLTHEVVKMVVFKVNLYAPNGQLLSFNGRVVGFSDRISSLLVPEEFMQWGNTRLGNQQQAKPSRVIIKTKNPGNPDLVKYLNDKKLVTDAEKTRFSRYRQVIDIVVNISWLSGAVMLVFALLIFTLFIQLTIASSKEEIFLLITLGTSPAQLRKFLIKQFFPVNLLVAGIALLLVSLMQFFAANYLFKQHIFISSLPSIYTFSAAFLVLLVIWWVNNTTIRNYIQPKRGK